MARRYPEGFVDYVRKHYMDMPLPELTKAANEKFGTNLNKSAMSTMKKRYKLNGAPRAKIYSYKFPEEVCRYIIDHYKGTGRQQMADLLLKEFGREYTSAQIKSFYHNHNLNSGITGHFVKGHPPHNKGKKMSPEVYEKIKDTIFQKGHRPHNTLPVGTEIVNEDGYHVTKVAEPNVWEFTHRLVWQQNFGEIPPGMLVSFKDTNKDNMESENLMLITMAENGVLNIKGLRSENAEITETGLNVAKLSIAVKQIRKRERRN